MSKAHLARFGVFCFFALGGLWLFFLTGGWWTGWGVFLLCGIVGGIGSEMLFKRLATPEEIREDLEVRVRNPDP